MNDNDLKKIADLVEERLDNALEPLKSDIVEIKTDLSEVKVGLSGVKSDVSVLKLDVSGLKKDISDVKKTQKYHSRSLDALAGDMEQVLTELKATHDEIGLWHQRDKREIDEIKNI